jgi:predicted DNA-binding transcriptional regulator AlpA
VKARHSDLSYTVNEFCQRYGLGRVKFYGMIARGEGPPIIKLGGSTRISVEMAEAWWKELQDKAIVDRTKRKKRSSK